MIVIYNINVYSSLQIATLKKSRWAFICLHMCTYYYAQLLQIEPRMELLTYKALVILTISNNVFQENLKSIQ